MSKNYYRGVPLLQNQAATGIGALQPYKTSDYQTLTVSVEGSATANLTLRCKGSIGTTAPTFTASASQANAWAPLQMISLDTGATVDGSTGVAVTSNFVQMYEVNVNSFDFVAFDVTSYTAGDVTVRVTPAGSDI